MPENKNKNKKMKSFDLLDDSHEDSSLNQNNKNLQQIFS
jgi:hypothetical protein